jgi:hypothetical protein
VTIMVLCWWWCWLFGWVVVVLVVAFSSNVGKLIVLAAVLLEPTRSGTGDVCGEFRLLLLDANGCFF